MMKIAASTSSNVVPRQFLTGDEPVFLIQAAWSWQLSVAAIVGPPSVLAEAYSTLIGERYQQESRTAVPPRKSLARSAVVYPASPLLDVCAHVTGRHAMTRALANGDVDHVDTASAPDLADVRGQAHAKRALTIAAAGAHSLLIL